MSIPEARARWLPPRETVEAGGWLIYVLHNIGELDLDPREAGFSAVVYGQSHKVEDLNLAIAAADRGEFATD
jgi:hypothetical protein